MSDTSEPEQKPKSIHDLLSLAGTIIPIIVGTSFILSICYDYFFLSALGLSFSNIPSQVSDHIRSAILWLPAMAGYAVANLLAFALIVPPNTNRTRYSVLSVINEFHIIFIILILITLLAIIILFAPVDIRLPTIIPVFLIAYFLRSAKTPLYFKYTRLEFYSIIAVFTFSVITFDGYSAATRILSEESPKIVLLIKVDDKTEEIKANGIRRFSEFSIVIDSNRQTTILPKDSILSEKSIKPIAIKESRACDYFQFGCKNKPVTPPAKAASSP